MNREQIEEKIVAIVKEMMEVEEVDLQDNLQEKYDLDSIDLFDFILSVEDEFQIEFADEDFEGMTSVQDIIDKVAERVL